MRPIGKIFWVIDTLKREDTVQFSSDNPDNTYQLTGMYNDIFTQDSDSVSLSCLVEHTDGRYWKDEIYKTVDIYCKF